MKNQLFWKLIDQVSKTTGTYFNLLLNDFLNPVWASKCKLHTSTVCINFVCLLPTLIPI